VPPAAEVRLFGWRSGRSLVADSVNRVEPWRRIATDADKALRGAVGRPVCIRGNDTAGEAEGQEPAEQ
jgi:hypothetical protein